MAGIVLGLTQHWLRPREHAVKIIHVLELWTNIAMVKNTGYAKVTRGLVLPEHVHGGKV